MPHTRGIYSRRFRHKTISGIDNPYEQKGNSPEIDRYFSIRLRFYYSMLILLPIIALMIVILVAS